jgi:hypothetical protein
VPQLLNSSVSKENADALIRPDPAKSGVSVTTAQIDAHNNLIDELLDEMKDIMDAVKEKENSAAKRARRI